MTRAWLLGVMVVAVGCGSSDEDAFDGVPSVCDASAGSTPVEWSLVALAGSACFAPNIGSLSSDGVSVASSAAELAADVDGASCPQLLTTAVDFTTTQLILLSTLDGYVHFISDDATSRVVDIGHEGGGYPDYQLYVLGVAISDKPVALAECVPTCTGDCPPSP